jgi:glycosyltransferase involved in cell wall biosynthesis
MEIVLALDSLLFDRAEFESYALCLVVPGGVRRNIPPLKCIRVIELRGFRSHFWEQFLLPVFVRGALLVNLSGSAPVFKRNQVFMIHDAAIFDFPQAYSKRFIAWYRFQFWIQTKRALTLLTVSEFSRTRLCKHLGIDKERFCIIKNGVDHMDRIESHDHVLASLNLVSNGYLLAVGSVNPSKNFKTLIDVFSTLKDAGSIPLVVVGGGNSAVFAEQDVFDDTRVIRTGRINDSQLKALYTHARAFVFPSLYEGFGIPPLEAMACGCPVIASNAASIPEVCGNAVGYFDPTSTTSIRSAIERVITDRHWRSELQVAGRNKAKEYTWKEAAGYLILHLKRIGAISS